MDAYHLFLLLFGGFFIGIIGSMFGIGGGLFAVPLFHFGFGLDLHQSIAASLVGIVASSMMSAMAKVHLGVLSIRLSKVLEIPSITGAIFGSLVIGALPINLLKILFSVVGFSMAFNMLKNPFKIVLGKQVRKHYIPADTKGEFADHYRDPSNGKTVRFEAQNIKWAVPISLSAGFLSSILGIGGGIVNVPLITQLCKCPIKVASATSGYKLGITACAGSVVYFAKGYIVPDVTLTFSLGILAGSYLGMAILLRTKPILVELFFGLLLTAVTLKMVLSI